MLVTAITVVIASLVHGFTVLAQDLPKASQGLINVYLFADDWSENLTCQDMTPIACLASRGAVDTSRLHCSKFKFSAEGELTIGEAQQLSLFTEHGGAVLLGSRPRGPSTKWTKIGTNSNHIPRDFLRVEVPDRDLSGGPRWYANPGPGTGAQALLATKSVGNYTQGPLGLCFGSHPG